MGIHGKKNDWLIFVTYWRGLKRRLKDVTTKMAESYMHFLKSEEIIQ
jgi:hypothetical protein